MVRRLGGKNTVPILVTGSQTFDDSGDIVQFAHQNCKKGRGLFPEDAAICEQVDDFGANIADAFGIEVRRIAYFQFLKLGRWFRKYNAACAPAWQRHCLELLFPIAAYGVKRHFNVNQSTVDRAEGIVLEYLDRIARRLANGEGFLFGDQFSAADLTFSSLFSPLLLPANFGVPLPKLEQLPSPLQTLIDNYRAHPAGQFALRMYQHYR